MTKPYYIKQYDGICELRSNIDNYFCIQVAPSLADQLLKIFNDEV